MKELTWMTWHERIETNELNWINETNELKWKNWNQELDKNKMKCMNGNEWIAKSAPIPAVFFLRFLCETELSLQSRAHFLDLIFKKWSETVIFLMIILFEIELSLYTVSCAFCRPLSGSRRETAETETLRRPPTATLPEKNTRFCTRECFQPWLHTFPIAHMMMRLTWWCDSYLWHSFVIQKFPS